MINGPAGKTVPFAPRSSFASRERLARRRYRATFFLFFFSQGARGRGLIAPTVAPIGRRHGMNKDVRVENSLRKKEPRLSLFSTGVTGCAKCYGNIGAKSRFTVFECKCFDKNAAGSVPMLAFRGALGQVLGEGARLNGLARARARISSTLDARVYTASFLTSAHDRRPLFFPFPVKRKNFGR